jgi:hypothetical protein
MKIGIYVQAILRFCLRNFRSCNVGITDYRGDICCAGPLSSSGFILRVSPVRKGTVA